MPRIVFERGAIEDIKNRLDSLIQTGQELDSTDFRKLARPRTGFLDEHEKLVFKRIKEKEGQSKYDIVKSLENAHPESLSRGPVFKAIKRLIGRGMVIWKPDPLNTQKHLLYVNKQSLIIQVENDLNSFKKSYLKLIRRAREEYWKKQDLTEDQLKKSKRPDLDIAEFYSVGVTAGLTKIFKQLVINYALNAIFRWREEIKDLESLNRLYLVVFQNLNEIFSEHVKSIPFDIQDENKRIAYLQEDLRYSIEDAKVYQEMIPEFDGCGVGLEFDSVMSSLFTAIKMDISWKDYRDRSVERS